MQRGDNSSVMFLRKKRSRSNISKNYLDTGPQEPCITKRDAAGKIVGIDIVMPKPLLDKKTYKDFYKNSESREEMFEKIEDYKVRTDIEHGKSIDRAMNAINNNPGIAQSGTNIWIWKIKNKLRRIFKL